MPGSAMAAVLLLCSRASGAGQGMCAHTEVDVLKAANPLTNLQHVTPYFLNSLRERSVRQSQVTGPGKEGRERERERGSINTNSSR